MPVTQTEREMSSCAENDDQLFGNFDLSALNYGSKSDGRLQPKTHSTAICLYLFYTFYKSLTCCMIANFTSFELIATIGKTVAMTFYSSH